MMFYPHNYPVSVEYDYEEIPECKHEYVNVSFYNQKFVCKHCDEEQHNDDIKK